MRNDSMSKDISMRREHLEFLDTLQLTVSVTVASQYSGISVKKFITDAADGFLIYKGKLPDELPDKHERGKWLALAEDIEVYVSELPPFAIRKYMLDQIKSSSVFELNLAAYKHRYGRKMYEELISDIVTIKTITEIQDKYFAADRKDVLDELLDKYCLGHTAYYNYLRTFNHVGLSRLIQDSQYSPRSICPLAEDFICECIFNEIDTNQEVLYEELLQLAEEMGEEACVNCPHNVNSTNGANVRNDIINQYPLFPIKLCRASYGRMRIPESRTTLARYIKRIDPAVCYLARTGLVFRRMKEAEYKSLDNVEYKRVFYEKKHRGQTLDKPGKKYNMHRYSQWVAKYGKKMWRDKPAKVNEVFFGDHCQLNVWLLAGYDRNHVPVIKRPWATCLLDYASGAIVGSVISFSVDKHSIAECLCRAAAMTIESPFYGLPEVLYLDRGKDFTSGFLLGKEKGDMTFGQRYPNCDVFSNGLVKMLGVKVRHAKPYSPWTKPIERTFRTITNRFLCRVPGNGGSKKRSQYADIIEAEKKRLLANNQLWTIEQFSYYWFHHIIPGFNNLKVRNNRSPLERYQSIERAETLIPSWSCLAGLLQEKKSVKVYDQGFYYNKDLYDDAVLAEYIGKKLFIYDFASCATECVYAMYIDEETGEAKFLGEIPKKESVEVIEPERVKMARNYAVQNIQKNRAMQEIEAIHYLNESMKMARLPYDDYDMATGLVMRTKYAEKAAAKPMQNQLASISPAALQITSAKLKEEARVIDQVLQMI